MTPTGYWKRGADGKDTWHQNVRPVSPFEAGYKAFRKDGLTARNPFSPQLLPWNREQWSAGYAKAEKEHR